MDDVLRTFLYSGKSEQDQGEIGCFRDHRGRALPEGFVLIRRRKKRNTIGYAAALLVDKSDRLHAQRANMSIETLCDTLVAFTFQRMLKPDTGSGCQA